MQKIKLSITCPTRSRLKSVERFISSAFDLAKDPDSVELIFMYDSDDPETKTFFSQSEYQRKNIIANEVPMTPEIVEAGINIHDLFFNPAGRMARGKYVWGTGNDVEFVTPEYDAILEHEIEEFLLDKPDRLCYTVINHDALVTAIEACAFPVFSKEHVDTIGGTMPNEITSWGADQAMYKIYQAGAPDRILRIPEKVAVKHWSYHTGRKHGEEEVGSGGSDGDSISYRLSTRVLNLNGQQFMRYVNALQNRKSQYES